MENKQKEDRLRKVQSNLLRSSVITTPLSIKFPGFSADPNYPPAAGSLAMNDMELVGRSLRVLLFIITTCPRSGTVVVRTVITGNTEIAKVSRGRRSAWVVEWRKSQWGGGMSRWDSGTFSLNMVRGDSHMKRSGGGGGGGGARRTAWGPKSRVLVPLRDRSFITSPGGRWF